VGDAKPNRNILDMYNVLEENRAHDELEENRAAMISAMINPNFGQLDDTFFS